MEATEVYLKDIKPHLKNPRSHNKYNLDVIKRSLSVYGQYKPLIVDKQTNEILAGNGTYQAMLGLGWEKCYCNMVEVNEKEAEQIMILDNRLSELSEWDTDELLNGLIGLEDKKAVGFDKKFMNEFLSVLSDENSLKEKLLNTTLRVSNKTEDKICPKCGGKCFRHISDK